MSIPTPVGSSESSVGYQLASMDPKNQVPPSTSKAREVVNQIAQTTVEHLRVDPTLVNGRGTTAQKLYRSNMFVGIIQSVISTFMTVAKLGQLLLSLVTGGKFFGIKNSVKQLGAEASKLAIALTLLVPGAGYYLAAQLNKLVKAYEAPVEEVQEQEMEEVVQQEQAPAVESQPKPGFFRRNIVPITVLLGLGACVFASAYVSVPAFAASVHSTVDSAGAAAAYGLSGLNQGIQAVRSYTLNLANRASNFITGLFSSAPLTSPANNALPASASPVHFQPMPGGINPSLNPEAPVIFDSITNAAAQVPVAPQAPVSAANSTSFLEMCIDPNRALPLGQNR